MCKNEQCLLGQRCAIISVPVVRKTSASQPPFCFLPSLDWLHLVCSRITNSHNRAKLFQCYTAPWHPRSVSTGDEQKDGLGKLSGWRRPCITYNYFSVAIMFSQEVTFGLFPGLSLHVFWCCSASVYCTLCISTTFSSCSLSLNLYLLVFWLIYSRKESTC